MRVHLANSEGKGSARASCTQRRQISHPKEKEKQYLEKLLENDQLVFRYCNKDGEYAEGRFPTNPNGSFHDIAGICNAEGTVFGLMPHPERAFYWWQQADWTKQQKMPEHGDGKLIFESLINHLQKA